MARPYAVPLEIGAKYGKWTVLRELPSKPRKPKGNIRFAECQCECGGVASVQVPHLRSGASSGCSNCAGRKEHPRNGDRNRTYRIWVAMRNRCKYPSTYAWKWYGAKGIRVCERWDSDYGNFLADMGEAPEGMSIDRIDRHGHYEPGNCKWSDQKTQMNNTARNIIVEYDGQKMSVTQLCDLTELPYRPVHWLIKRRGMSAAEAVETIRARQPQNLTGLQRRQSV